MSEWISVSDALPDDKSSVDLWSEGERITDMFFFDGKFHYWNNDWYEWGYPTSHWMHIPKPPNSQTKSQP